jgi:hypothetical protein
MIRIQVIRNDTAVAFAGFSGQFRAQRDAPDHHQQLPALGADLG